MITKAVLIGLVLCLPFVVNASVSASRSASKTVDYTADETSCTNLNESCKNCTTSNDCYWCASSDQCLKWSSNGRDIHCKGYNYYYRQCKLNGVALIAVFVVVVVVIIGLCICCCVCCCCCCISRRRKRNYEILQETHQNRNQAIYSGSNERKAERAARREEIRRKYERVDSYNKNEQYA